MSADAYADLVRSGVGAAVAKRVGAPRPPRLRRHRPGDDLLVGPAVLLPGPDASPDVAALLAGFADGSVAPEEDTRYGAVVLDARHVREICDLAPIRRDLAPVFRGMRGNGRVILLGADLAPLPGIEARAAQRALDGIVRTLGKEARGGTTVNLLRVAEGSRGLGPALEFFLSARSAFVDGQVLTVGPTSEDPTGPQTPEEPRVAVVTGAAQGIGASIAEILAREGAHVVCVDLAAQGEGLARVANRVGGSTLHLDITAPAAAQRLGEHLRRRFDGVDVVVHNAGITRDRSFVNLDDRGWDSVLAVNLQAPLRLTEGLLDQGDVLRAGARIVCLSSINGIAGAKGQSNYAASKSGVIGLVEALAPVLAERGMTVNAVAPGFIETAMTAAIPVVAREVGRRANSLQQGGLPVDVAEAVAWLAAPGTLGVTGQVLRVCGQNLVGA
ncbi:3-oxoacyl-ACP reductase [Kineococcus gynurae]|uniref:3-oxoacyl-ACP reductase n=1 Tax=Kineococcus gynurae TaxID=452979 RepID=A0ABV5LRP9_9ACTN